jgi:hypothetical protein
MILYSENIMMNSLQGSTLAWAALGVLLCGSSAFAAGSKTLPATERAEKRLAELLRPGVRFDSTGLRTRPLRWPIPHALEQPAVPLSLYRGMPPHIELAEGKPTLPRPLAEGQPLVSYVEQPQPPKRVELPTGPLLRLLSTDAREPLPLPILARPQKDRASLADPTLEASIAAALKPLTPARDKPLPFTPVNLPDPFEYIPAGQLRNPPEESVMPPYIPLRTPTR